MRETNRPCRSLSLRVLFDAITEQGECPVAEQNKKQSDQQSGHQETGQDRNQQKSETQRRAEEAARRDKPKGDGTVGT